mgnify:CR=1 FL=1
MWIGSVFPPYAQLLVGILFYKLVTDLPFYLKSTNQLTLILLSVCFPVALTGAIPTSLDPSFSDTSAIVAASLTILTGTLGFFAFHWRIKAIRTLFLRYLGHDPQVTNLTTLCTAPRLCVSSMGLGTYGLRCPDVGIFCLGGDGVWI